MTYEIDKVARGDVRLLKVDSSGKREWLQTFATAREAERARVEIETLDAVRADERGIYPGLSLKAVAKRVDAPRSAVDRALKALVDRGDLRSRKDVSLALRSDRWPSQAGHRPVVRKLYCVALKVQS